MGPTRALVSGLDFELRRDRKFQNSSSTVGNKPPTVLSLLASSFPTPTNFYLVVRNHICNNRKKPFNYYSWMAFLTAYVLILTT